VAPSVTGTTQLEQARAQARSTEAVLRVEGLSKTFAIPRHRMWTLKERLKHPITSFGHDRLEALDDISFEVARGEFFAVIGRNGSGKSTLLRCIAGIHQPDSGVVEVNSSVAPFIELGVGFHPQLAARDNVEVAGTLMGLRPGEARRRFPSVITFAELEDFVDLQLGNYSSGMQVRLAFATSFQVDAEMLLFDEVLAVGDEVFRQKSLATFERLIERGNTIIYVSHALDTVSKLADRVLLLDQGKAVALGEPEMVLERYEELGRDYVRERDAIEARGAASRRPDELELPDSEVLGTGKPPSGLRRFVDVTMTLARADFKLRYLDSIIGYVWSLVQPLLLFLVMWFVWTELFPHTTDVPYYDVMLLLGIALFTFFSEATGAALTSLVSKGDMLRKIPFPPVALPLSSVLTSFYVYSFSLVIVLGFMLVNGITPSFRWLEMIPVMLLLLVFTVGLALLLSFLYVGIRDIEQVWLVVQRMMFFITPVFFPIEFAPAGLQEVLMLNPLAVVTVQARHALLDPSAPTALEAGGATMIAGAFLITGAIVAAGLFLYRKRVHLVAERI
jgi:ABC-type polysaccharide/polyol phosphate transport system ATPase subunit/ABC-type polysaccharide/polyol phosphate export permease